MVNFIVFLIATTVVIQSKPVDLEYKEEWSASKKMEVLWKQIERTKDQSTWWWFPFKLMFLPFDDMNLSFEKNDFMQNSWYSFGLSPREKRVHTVGVV